MAGRGPAPKPSVIQILKGDPGKRATARLKHREPHPVSGLPDCPDWLSESAKAEWGRIVDEFGEMQAAGQRLLTALDVGGLIAYCEAVSNLERLTQMVKKVKGMRGLLPKIVQQTKAMLAVRSLAAEFGFTPASRTRVHVEAPRKGESEAEREFGY